MTTDDERREVAHNIRENYVCDGLGYKAATAYNIAMAIGMNPGVLVGDIELWNRLADLIEPGCDATATHTDDTATRDVSQCRRSDVDRDALLALADDMQWSVDHHDGIRSIMRDFKRGKLSEDKIVEMLVLGWEKDAKTIREAVGA